MIRKDQTLDLDIYNFNMDTFNQYQDSFTILDDFNFGDLNNFELNYDFNLLNDQNLPRSQCQLIFGYDDEEIGNPPIVPQQDHSMLNDFHQNLNSVPCSTRTENSRKVSQSPQLSFHKRKRKRKIELSDIEESFKNEYYKFFTNKKKFSKKFVIAIHKIIMVPLSLPAIKRDQTRQIDLYFQDFAYAKDKIFDYIKEHKEELSLKVFQ